MIVSYDEAETDKFIELADYIEDHIAGVEVQGNPGGAAPAGTFSILQEDGTMLFERSSELQYPNLEKLASVIQDKIAVTGGAPGVGCM